MPFELAEYHEARITGVTTRVEKHGDEDKPAVSIAFEITDANTILDRIDATVRHALYKSVEEANGQTDLPEIEAATPVLRSNSIDRVTLPLKLEGWTLQMDNSVDENEPMRFGGCKVDKFTAEPKQGGSVVLRFRVGTSDIDAERLGQLGMCNGQAVWIQLHAPKLKDEAIDGSREGGGPGFDDADDEPNAGDLFAAAHGEDFDE